MAILKLTCAQSGLRELNTKMVQIVQNGYLIGRGSCGIVVNALLNPYCSECNYVRPSGENPPPQPPSYIHGSAGQRERGRFKLICQDHPQKKNDNICPDLIVPIFVPAYYDDA